ncbi:hypothetical protein DXG01_012342 [Tephrocybe rancida]|nr:hypothetical protein DXG01_012342 [Tephrocybe rancida]
MANGGPREGHNEDISTSRRFLRIRWWLPTLIPTLKRCANFINPQQDCPAQKLHAARFWGWSENKREEEKDLAELTQRASEGKSLYGDSPQPQWVQEAAARNSQFSQLKFYLDSKAAFPMVNLVNHSNHGTDPAKYGVKPTEDSN